MAEIPLNETQAAERLGVRPSTLAHWRCAGIGPRYAKIGGRVRYFPGDLADFIASRIVEPQGDRGAA